jgi:hypothetical protein
MGNGTRILLGLGLLGRSNPIAFVLALPLLLILGVAVGAALLFGWLIIKTVELICRISRKPVTPALPPSLESNRPEKW